MGLGVPHVGCLARNKAPAQAHDFPRAFPVERDNIREPVGVTVSMGESPKASASASSRLSRFWVNLPHNHQNFSTGPCPKSGQPSRCTNCLSFTRERKSFVGWAGSGAKLTEERALAPVNREVWD